ncbi:hypothetical protein Tco_0116370 [Tanacetum coccineum]
MLKQEFLEFRVSESEGLHKGYDRFQKILRQLNQMQAKPDNEDYNMKFLRALPLLGSQDPLPFGILMSDRVAPSYDSRLSEEPKAWWMLLPMLTLVRPLKCEDEEKGDAQVYGMIAGDDDDAAGDASGDVYARACAEYALMGKVLTNGRDVFQKPGPKLINSSCPLDQKFGLGFGETLIHEVFYPSALAPLTPHAEDVEGKPLYDRSVPACVVGIHSNLFLSGAFPVVRGINQHCFLLVGHFAGIGEKSCAGPHDRPTKQLFSNIIECLAVITPMYMDEGKMGQL